MEKNFTVYETNLIIAILVILFIILGVLIFFIILPLNVIYDNLLKVITNTEEGITLVDCLAGNAQLAFLDLCNTGPFSICTVNPEFCTMVCPFEACVVPVIN